MLVWLEVAILGSLVALLLATTYAQFPDFATLLSPWLAFLRAIPPIALFPIGLMIGGHGTRTILLVSAGCLALILFPILRANIGVAIAKHRDLMAVLRLSPKQRLLMVVLPSLGVELAGVARSALTLALALTIAGEILIGGSRTVGRLFVESLELYRLATAYALVVLMGICGLASDLFGSVLQRFAKGERND